MSLGVDVSKLYTNMIMAASTTDPVQKKMVYSYLCSYAQEKSELALLCINTLQNDCRNQEPMIRALALRSLCSLRMKDICEYALDPLRALLNDRSAYVRRTAVLQWVKLYSFLPQQISDVEPSLLDNIFGLMNDTDGQVMINALNALQEILALVIRSIEQQQIDNVNNGIENGEIVVPFGLNPELLAQRGIYYYVSQPLILQLFNRFDTIPEWGQSYILELATHYTPSDDEEMFAIMNILDSLLQHNNTAVVTSAIKLFLHITQNHKEIQQDVYYRIRTPLITALLVSPIELVYVALAHIKVIAIKAPHVFFSDFKYFFIKYNDLLCVKVLKLQILSLIATQDTASSIIEELHEYTYDRDDDVVKSAIQGISTISILVPSSLDQAVDTLVGLLEFKKNQLANYVAISCRDILRKYPEKYTEIVPSFQSLLQERDLTALISNNKGSNANGTKTSTTFDSKHAANVDSSAICAIVWMLGEFGEDIKSAPYVLESLIDSLIEAVNSTKECIANGSIQPSAIVDPFTFSQIYKDSGIKTTLVVGDVQLYLLNSCMKLVFKRPAEIQAMLGRLFDVLLSNDHTLGSGVEHLIDVPTKQQAVLYYRMLASSLGETSKILTSKSEGIAHSFWEFEALHDDQSKQLSYFFTEFNSLSIIYGIPESAFKRRTKTSNDDDEAAEAAEQQKQHVYYSDLDGSNISSANGASGNQQHFSQPSPQQRHIVHDQVNDDNHNNDNNNAGGDNNNNNDDEPCNLQPGVELEAETFQELWENLPDFSVDFEISQNALENLSQIEEKFTSKNIFTMAAGEDDNEHKFFSYGIDSDKTGNDEQPLVFLLEIVIVMSTGGVTVTLKSNGNEEQCTHVVNLVGTIMTEF